MHSCSPYSATISCVCDADNSVLRCVSRLRWARARGVISSVCILCDGSHFVQKVWNASHIELVRTRELSTLSITTFTPGLGRWAMAELLCWPCFRTRGRRTKMQVRWHQSQDMLACFCFCSASGNLSKLCFLAKLIFIGISSQASVVCFKNKFLTFEYPLWIFSFRRSFFRIFNKPWMDRMDNRVSGTSLCLWNTSEVSWSGHI